jgi:hypothetical protein
MFLPKDGKQFCSVVFLKSSNISGSKRRTARYLPSRRARRCKTSPLRGAFSCLSNAPPTLLRGQDYIVTLKGQTAAGQTEIIGEYYFRVERSPSQNTPTPEPQL